ncbi:MAG: hypothetical protein ACREXU_19360 [Gammaproteobacteria bacterium]
MKADTLKVEGKAANRLVAEEYQRDPAFAGMVETLRASPKTFVFLSSDVDPEVAARWREWPGAMGAPLPFGILARRHRYRFSYRPAERYFSYARSARGIFGAT